MKQKLPVVVLSFLVIALTVALWQRDRTIAAPNEGTVDKKERTIHVSGTGSVRVNPDSARLFFGVDVTEKTIKDARREANAKVAKVIESIKDLKIDSLKLKTSDVQVSPVHQHRRERDGEEKTILVGYRCNIRFTVLVQNPDSEKLSVEAAKVLDAGLENGANVVESIAFFKEKWQQHQREAMTKAVENAIANAQAMAAGAKVTIVSTTTMTGDAAHHWGGRNQHAMVQNVQVGDFGRGSEDPTPIVAGDLVFSYTVHLVCNY
jgi:uncharacterized protein YggE